MAHTVWSRASRSRERRRRTRAARLTVAVSLGGNMRPALGHGGRSVTLTGPAGGVLRYTDLSASDASGRSLHSWLSVQGGRILLHVLTRGARYPLRLDPLVQQGEPFTASPEEKEFGRSVAISADGSTAIVGGDIDPEQPGAAYVFVHTGASWTQQAILTGVGESNVRGFGAFGTSVAISEDGETAVVGGPADGGGLGAVWMFTRSGSTWTQQGTKLTPSGAVGEAQFGQSVALSAAGNTLLVGAPGAGKKLGAVWVFTRSGESWSQEGETLTGIGEKGKGQFGYSVALSGDGDTALIGGPSDRNNKGAAWFFTSSGEGFTQNGEKLTGSGEKGKGQFGWSVALSSDAGTAMIGGPDNDDGRGAAWVYEQGAGAGVEQGEKLAVYQSEKRENAFGSGVALSTNGNTALVAAELAFSEGVGAVYVYTRTGDTWTRQIGALLATERGLFMGGALALSGSGEIALAAASGGGTGLVYAYEQGPEEPMPHWYADEVRVDEDESSFWHAVALSGSMGLHLSDGVDITCNRLKGKQWIKNPTSGAAGNVVARGLTGSDCEATTPLCPLQQDLRLLTPEYEKEGGFEMDGGKTPSRFPDTRAVPSEEIRVRLRGREDTSVLDELTGELTPQVGNSVLEFGPGSGELQQGHGLTATVTGTIDLTGKKRENPITAKTP